MKKSLLALAVLGAAASAQAADVSVYGVVDTGLAYTYQDNWGIDSGTVAHTTDGESSLEMASGINASSRVGIVGSEDLGNGMKVSFKLESGINTDDGALNQGGRLFGREASLTLSGEFGKISAGRMGGVGSSAGTYDYVYLIGEAFDGGDFNIWGMTASSRYDNMITYETPEFAGVKVTVQYSFDGDVNGDNDDYDPVDNPQHGTEGKSSVDRYASLAVTGGFGNLQFVGAYEYFNHASTSAVKDDGHLFHLGGNYDFGVTKVFALAQYYQGIRNAAGWDLTDDLIDNVAWDKDCGTDGFKGYGLHIGSITPIGGGDLTVAAYFQDGKLQNIYSDPQDKFDIDAQYVGLTARYAYHLSKRTDAYLGAGYAKATLDTSAFDEHDMEKELIQAYVGLTHRF